VIEKKNNPPSKKYTHKIEREQKKSMTHQIGEGNLLLLTLRGGSGVMENVSREENGVPKFGKDKGEKSITV
jgi:hypothetical protein